MGLIGWSRKGNGEGLMCVVFHEAETAAGWCIRVQQELMEVDWPIELLSHPAAAEDWADVNDTVIFRVTPF